MQQLKASCLKGMLGADLNKEQWHEDPFGDIAAEVRAQNGK